MDRNAIILLIILFTFLSPPNTYLSPSATQLSLSLSLSSLVSISSLLPISFSLSFFLSLTLFLSLCISILSLQIQPISAPLSLSLSFFFFPVTISLSFFSCHEEEGNPDLKQSSPIEARQSEPLLADLKLCSPRGSRRSLLIILHSFCR